MQTRWDLCSLSEGSPLPALEKAQVAAPRWAPPRRYCDQRPQPDVEWSDAPPDPITCANGWSAPIRGDGPAERGSGLSSRALRAISAMTGPSCGLGYEDGQLIGIPISLYFLGAVLGVASLM